MAKKPIDPKETYNVKELFGCGEGHFLTPGFTHWESGEACPQNHEPGQPNKYYHLYYRKFMVPTHQGTKEDRYSKDSPTYDELFRDNPGKWGQLPLAP